MKISYSWLKDYIKLEQSPEEICDILTQTGLEVGGLEEVETGHNNFLSGSNIRCATNNRQGFVGANIYSCFT